MDFNWNQIDLYLIDVASKIPVQKIDEYVIIIGICAKLSV
jgi:hypothetical protein